MGRKLGIVLVGIGVFVLALSLLSRFYVYDRLAVVPVDFERTPTSTAEGATVFDIATQEEITVDLLAERTVVGQVEDSEQASEELDRDVAVWENSVVTDEPGTEFTEERPPRSVTHDMIAFDRHTGEVVDWDGNFLVNSVDAETGEEIRDTDTPITGQYYKLPFNAQKKTYKFWDGALKQATDMSYRATEDIDGITVYRYEQTIEPTDVGDINAPASIFGIDEEGDVTLDRIYSNTRTIWVEPETGVVIRGQEDQFVTAEYQGDQVATLTDATIRYDDETVAAYVEDYEPLASQLKIVRVWLPLVGGLLGGLLILVGLALMLRRRPRDESAGDRRADRRTLTPA